MKETWKPVKGYEGRYEISNLGKVKSPKRVDASGHLRKEKILKLNMDKKGYPYIGLYKDGKKKYPKIHRLVAIHFIPNPENKEQVNHKDGNKSNNTVSNLEWVTAEENVRHAIENGLRDNLGENNPDATLTNDIVRRIKTYRKEGWSKWEAYREEFTYINRRTYARVWDEETWKHIKV